MLNNEVKAEKALEDEVGVLPTSSSKIDHEVWFDANIHNYRTLAQMVATTLKGTLEGHGISYVDIPFREKGKKSFLKKIEDKNKKKVYCPQDMTDLAGIRVITLIESDVQKVGELIKNLFNVHIEDSVNKSESLGSDKVGYRSDHFVCDIGEKREGLLEWKSLKGLCFEIQVRTALMHAWAEIEHDRGYKLGGQLPSHLIRRFSLLSGLLESADLEFNRLTVEIEEYTRQVEEDIKKDKELNIELTTAGLKALVKNKYNSYFSHSEITDNFYLELVFKELQVFGIKSLKDLDAIFQDKIEYHKRAKSESIIGFLRNIMLFSDMKKYFKENSNRTKTPPFGVLDTYTYEILNEIHGENEVSIVLNEYNIKIDDF